MKNNIIPSVKLLAMSSSKLKDTACDRFYFWCWILNLVPRKLKLPLWFGSIMHAGFEALTIPAKHKSINKIIDKTSRIETAKFVPASEDTEEIRLQLQIAKIIIKVYMREFKSEIKKMCGLHTEVPFSFKLARSPVTYEGTIDAYGTEKNKIFSVERKTARVINDDFFKLLRFDPQINGYAHAIKHELAGKYPAYCDYMAFRKPQIRVTKKETVAQFLIRLEEDLHERKDWYFVSHEHRFGPRSIQEAIDDIEQITLNLYNKYKSLSKKQLLDPYYWPRRKEHCLSYGVCPYFTLCKNCKQYQLYLRLFQPRELRYATEHQELRK